MNKELKSAVQFDEWANTYDSVINEWYFNQTINKVLNNITKSEFKLVDVGCGTGNLLFRLSQLYPQAQLTGIDISESMIEVARKKLKKEINLHVLSADNITILEPNSCDYIVCSHSLHHHKSVSRTLNEFKRILKNNGAIIITDGTLDSIFHKIYFNLVNMTQNEPYVTRHSTSKLHELFNKAGFKISSTSTVSIFNKIFVLKNIS